MTIEPSGLARNPGPVATSDQPYAGAGRRPEYFATCLSREAGALLPRSNVARIRIRHGYGAKRARRSRGGRRRFSLRGVRFASGHHPRKLTTSTKPEKPVPCGRSDIGEPTTDISLLALILATEHKAPCRWPLSRLRPRETPETWRRQALHSARAHWREHRPP
jgi:hypothetical protein